MTIEELNAVRDIKFELVKAKRALDVWKRASSIKVPSNTGLSKTKTANSGVERIAIKIIEAENRVTALQEKLSLNQATLEEQIISEIGDSEHQALLILRYVECMSFKDIAKVMHYSEKHIYRLHDWITMDVKKNVSQCQLHVSQSL